MASEVGMTKAERRKMIISRIKSARMTAVARKYWAERRQRERTFDAEPRDTTIETAGNADYEIQELPDVLSE